MSADRDVAEPLRRSLAIRIGIALAVLAAVAVVAATMLGDHQPARNGIPASVATAPAPSPEAQPKAAEASAADGKTLPGEATGSTDSVSAEGKTSANPLAPGRGVEDEGATGTTAQRNESQPATASAQATQPPPNAMANDGPTGKEADGGSPGASATAPAGGDKAGAQKSPAPAENAQAAAAAALRSPPGAKPPRGPHLQAGVFLQPSNAQAFKSNLEAQGLPVYIESRVHVGPFRDRKEAERMREQLREMGVSTVLIAQ